MTLDLAKLRALAEAATPGPWRHYGSAADSAFIAAAHPQAVMELIDEVERLRASLSRWEALGDRHDIQPREPGCRCDREPGDSACPVHGVEE